MYNFILRPLVKKYDHERKTHTKRNSGTDSANSLVADSLAETDPGTPPHAVASPEHTRGQGTKDTLLSPRRKWL